MHPARTLYPMFFISLLLPISFAPAASRAAEQYTVMYFGGMAYSDAIDESGQVVGQVALGGGLFHAGLWNGTSIDDLGTLGGMTSSAWDINDAGIVVGESDTAEGNILAFVWNGGPMTPLDSLTEFVADAAYGINDDGIIVGRSGVDALSHAHAVRWEGGVPLDLGTLGGLASSAEAINDPGQIVGWSWNAASRPRPFLWEADTGMNDLGTLGGTSGFAAAINDAGQIVGRSQLPADTGHRATLWDGGSVIDLGVLPGSSFSEAFDINASGQIVGRSPSAGGGGFLWEAGTLHAIDDLLIPADAGWSITSARSINDQGWILGFGRLGNFVTDVVLKPAPEPGATASWLAAIAGLGGLAARRHARSRS